MKKKPMRKVHFIYFILLYIVLSPTIVLAEIFPNTTILHQATQYFVAGERLQLEAELKDAKGIVEARCYFKTGLDDNYLFVSMDLVSGDTYHCSIPALKTGSQSLEYLFLIVNSGGQVVRSTPYIAQEAIEDVNQQQQNTNDFQHILPIYNELGEINKLESGIEDGYVDFIHVRDSSQLNGLLAGVYSPEEIPATLKSVQGYFGGFVLDHNNSILPVKGFAPNLNNSQSLEEQVIIEEFSQSPLLQSTTSGIPEIGGDDWSGYFTRTDGLAYEDLTASVILSGSSVTIKTTLTGLGNYLAGSINSRGDMLLYDSYDGEDWTTHFGPATSTEIRIYDFIWPPSPSDPEPPLNVIILKRPPLPPENVQASDGLYKDKITVSWSLSSDATSYVVYACEDESSDTCISLSEVSNNEYTDSRQVLGKIFFRIKACNENGCGQFSEYDSGHKQYISIVPMLHLLL